MFEVSISGWFAAAHQLRLPDGSREPLHGHNWRVVATFEGRELDETGMLVDFTLVKPRLDGLLAGLHDRNLNDLSAFEQRDPSAEQVAIHIAEKMGEALPERVALACVEVEEAPGCVARYRPGR
jgi:6-pyruvoyltetrahydropterin/6-carboxytetrahydropterin synthase